MILLKDTSLCFNIAWFYKGSFPFSQSMYIVKNEKQSYVIFLYITKILDHRFLETDALSSAACQGSCKKSD